MDEELKERLAQMKAKKRAAVVKPRDMALIHWAVACDHAKEHGWGETERVEDDPAYLRYVTEKVIDTLVEYLPHLVVHLHSGPKIRPVVLFHCKTLTSVLGFLKLDERKYIRRAYPVGAKPDGVDMVQLWAPM